MSKAPCVSGGVSLLQFDPVTQVLSQTCRPEEQSKMKKAKKGKGERGKN